MPTVSSPNWASMIMGAGPEAHGVTSNAWQPDRYDFPPVVCGTGRTFPPMFGELRRHRRDAVIGVFHDWDDFGRLLERESVDLIEDSDGPVKTVDAAVTFIRERKPILSFVHLDHVDHAGHELGWMSTPYFEALEVADALVARLLGALDEAGVRSRTLVLLTSDHGGVGKKHGGLTVAEIEIPWMVAGPGVRRGHVITTPVSTIDTAPTVMYALGQALHPAWTGRPVLEAFQVAD